MNAKEFAEEMKQTVAGIKANGIEAIKCENIMAYLDEVLNSPEDEPRPIDVERYRADLQNWIEANKYQHENHLELFRSVITAGQNAIKSSFLLNGGAAVALLAFIAHLAEFDPTKISAFAACLVYFAIGAFAVAVISGLTYLSQWWYGSDYGWARKLGFGCNIACILLGIGSYAIFAWGLLAAHRAFLTFG